MIDDAVMRPSRDAAESTTLRRRPCDLAAEALRPQLSGAILVSPSDSARLLDSEHARLQAEVDRAMPTTCRCRVFVEKILDGHGVVLSVVDYESLRRGEPQ